MIVDTSALMAILFGEPDAIAYAGALEATPDVHISAATVVEAFIVASAASAGAELQSLLQASGITTQPFTARQAEIASTAHRRYGRGSGHPARLNFGDTFAYALAADLSESLLFKGDDFARTDIRSALQ